MICSPFIKATKNWMTPQNRQIYSFTYISNIVCAFWCGRLCCAMFLVCCVFFVLHSVLKVVLHSVLVVIEHCDSSVISSTTRFTISQLLDSPPALFLLSSFEFTLILTVIICSSVFCSIPCLTPPPKSKSPS